MVAPLSESISLRDVSMGTNDWYNVASTVRRAISACTDHITDQATLIRQLDERFREREHHIIEQNQLLDEMNRKADNMNVLVLERKVTSLEKTVSEAMGTLMQLRSEVQDIETTSSRNVSKMEQQLTDKMHRMESKLEMQMEKRMEALEDAMERRMGSKLESRQMEEYSSRVTDVFDRAVAASSEAALRQLEQHAVRITSEVEEVAASKADARDFDAFRRRVQSEMAEMAEVADDVARLRDALDHKADANKVSKLQSGLEAAAESAAAAMAIAEEKGEAAGRRAERAADGTARGVRSEMDDLREEVTLAHQELSTLHELLFGAPPGAGGGGGGAGAGSGEASLAGTPPASAGGAGGAFGTPPGSGASARARARAHHHATPRRGTPGGLVHIGSPGTAADAASAGVMVQVASVNAELADLRGHVERNTAGLRSLTGNQAELMSMTYRRVDEHATAIQKLSQGITANLEDRPTAASVQALVSDAVSRVDRRAEAAMTPLKERIKVLEVDQGIHETQAQKSEMGLDAAVKDNRRRITALESHVAESDRQLSAIAAEGGRATMRAELRSLVEEHTATHLDAAVRAVEEQSRRLGQVEAETGQRVPSLAASMEAAERRIQTLEAKVEEDRRRAKSLGDDHEARVARVEGEQQVVVASSRALAGKVNNMLQQDVLTATATMADDHGRRLGSLEALAKSMGARLAEQEAGGAAASGSADAGMRVLTTRVQQVEESLARSVEGALRQSSTVQSVAAELGQLREDVTQSVGGRERVAMIVESTARVLVKEELRLREEKDEVRWQVLLDRFANLLGHKVDRTELGLAAEAEAFKMRSYDAQKLEVGELPRHLGLLGVAYRGYVDERCAEIEAQWGELLRGVEAALTARTDRLLERVEVIGGHDPARRVAGDLWKMVERKADRSELDAVRAELARRATLDDLEAYTARKLDVRTFLASTGGAGARALAHYSP